MEKSRHLKNEVKHWWIYIITGVLLLIAGVIMLLRPGLGYLFISIYFSITLLVTGIVEIYFSVSNRKEIEKWAWSLLGGILDLIIGVILLTYPLLTMAIIPFILSFWLIFRGIALMFFASLVPPAQEKSQWGWFFLLGFGLFVYGLVILFNPAFGAATAIGLVSVGFIIAGILNIAFSFKLKQVKNHFILHKPSSAH